MCEIGTGQQVTHLHDSYLMMMMMMMMMMVVVVVVVVVVVIRVQFLQFLRLTCGVTVVAHRYLTQ